MLFVTACEPKRTQDEAWFVRQAIKKYLPHQRNRSFMEIIDTRDLQHHIAEERYVASHTKTAKLPDKTFLGTKHNYYCSWMNF